jgi:glycosyltransferase involved in cell wall biosynthesis
MNSFLNSKYRLPELAVTEAAGNDAVGFPVAMVDPSLFTVPYDEALAAALRALGQEVTLVGRPLRAGESPPRVPYRAGFYRRFDAAPRRWGRAGAALKGIEHVLGELGVRCPGAGPGLLHFQWLPFPLADAVVLRLAARRGPIVVTVHDTVPFNGTPTSRLQRLGFVAALRAAHRLIVHTESGRQRLIALRLTEGRIRVIPHGPLGIAGRRDPTHSDRRWTVVAFGKMRAYKGLEVLVEAVARLEPSVRNRLRVVIAGEPMMDLALLRRAAARLEATIELVPRRLDEGEMAALFGSADAFVFPHLEVEASGVFFQVAGLGRWVIASRIGAFAEALEDGASGRLVPPGDPARLSEALAEGTARRPRPSAAPRVTDWETIARATLAAYAEAWREWSAEGERQREGAVA